MGVPPSLPALLQERHLRAKCPIPGAKAETGLLEQVRAHHKDPGPPLRSHLAVLMGDTNHPLGIWAGGSALAVEDSEDQGSNTERRKRQTLDALVSPCRPRERVQTSSSGGDIHLMNLSSLTEEHGLAFEATSR